MTTIDEMIAQASYIHDLVVHARKKNRELFLTGGGSSSSKKA